MKVIWCMWFAAFVNASFAQEGEWKSLLDKDLTQWNTYLSFRHELGYNGNAPKDKGGALINPVGYNKDETEVFSTSIDNGETILRISGEIYGCIFTKAEFENYHLKLKVKWGSRKDDPRKDKLKDSGVLYHSIGKSGVDYWRSWMLSQEFQIMEGHMGDYWPIATSGIDIRAYLPEGDMNSVADASQPFLSFGSGGTESFCLRSENAESRAGEWTTLELVTFQDKSLHIVNGKVVMILKNSRYQDGHKTVPLTKGKIQLQSEAAEVFFKDVQIRSINALPVQYEALYR